MKKFFYSAASFTLIIMLMGCATIPVMNLNHLPESEGYQYDNAGTIVIQKFDDERPLKEREGGKAPKNSKQVWSGSTNPSAQDYLQNTMETEFRKSGLFSVAETADYELTGVIKSLKAERRLGTLGYVSMPFSFLGAFLVGWGDIGTGLIIYLPGLALNIAKHDPYEATIAMEVTLKKNDQVVWQETIVRKHNEKIWAGFTSIKKISRNSSRILDKGVTIAIRDMIKEISSKI